MINKNVILTSSGLKNIVTNINNDENEFKFIFGDREIRMSKIYADFISPLISRQHLLDPTLNTYRYPSDESMNEIFIDEIISFVELLSRGESIEINESQGKKLQYLSVLLYNEELYLKLNEIFPPNVDQIKIENIISHFSIYEYLHRFGDSHLIDISTEINQISRNFYKISTDNLKNLPRKILLSIIQSPELKLDNEDSLLSFIYEIFVNETVNNEASEDMQINEVEFLESVEFSCLSQEKLFEFVELFDINTITQNIWTKLKKCLFVTSENAKKNQINNKRYIHDKSDNKRCNHDHVKEIEYNGKEKGALKGIIFSLTKKFNGNVSDKNEVIITASSLNDPSSNYSPKNAADFEDKESYFASNYSSANQWLKYDFKNRKIKPTHYSISHTINEQGWSHPVQWVIEGSNTDADNDWKILDSRNNIKELKGTKTFEIQNQSEFFQYIRIRQTGPSSLNSNNLNISALEYFGLITNY